MVSTWARKAVVPIIAGAAVLATATPAVAQPVQDGLVNVNIGDITILEDVRVAAAAQVVAQICGLNVGPVVLLGRAVDRGGPTVTVCESNMEPVTISQNSE